MSSTQQEKRTVPIQAQKGLTTSDLLLTAVLLAAGQVLKSTVGTMIASATGGAIKPNFIIAMYCLAILIVRPRFREAIIIGLLAGAVNQILPATPLINFGSEVVGALVICLIAKLPFASRPASLAGTVTVLAGTFIATISSGFSFVGLQYLLLGVNVAGKVISLPEGYFYVFLGVIFGTASVNAIIVATLYPALRRALRRNTGNAGE